MKYTLNGETIPSLTKILDNCKIGGIGNLLYRANQAGLAGHNLRDANEDNTNAGWLAYKLIKSILGTGEMVNVDEYSASCIDRAAGAVDAFSSWHKSAGHLLRNNLPLVSESLKYGDTVDIFKINDKSTAVYSSALIMVTIHSQVYPEDLIKLAAQANLLSENAICGINAAYILRVDNPKTADDVVGFHVHKCTGADLEYPFQVFKKMRELYDMQDMLKTLV